MATVKGKGEEIGSFCDDFSECPEDKFWINTQIRHS